MEETRCMTETFSGNSADACFQILRCSSTHVQYWLICHLPLCNSTSLAHASEIPGITALRESNCFPSIILPIFSWLPQTSCAHSAHFALTNGTLWVLAVSPARMPRRKRSKLFTYNLNEISKKRSDAYFFFSSKYPRVSISFWNPF